ncbi:substrate-binding domain-containing protein [Emcibacter sp. SYSU 3D8]|uniref:substrate-binding domain-containing protein n=1 Tax=Emcibacter sp. SYSU 3D8 TaxID=3133969 RepID=UPI0031FF20C5
MNKTLIGLATVAVVSAAASGAAHARDRIQVVGSSTVFPYSQAAAEEFANKSGKPAPVVESTGTGGGMKIFCQGVGPDHPDVTGASRAMKKSEFELCAKNGVTDVSEALIGYDGLSIAVSRKGKDMDLTKKQIFLALAAQVPGKDGKLIANPYKNWKEIDTSLPDLKIQVFGPPPTSGTRDAFVELAMREGCKEIDFYKKMEKKDIKANCDRMRQDGLFVEAGENDNLIVQRLNTDPTALGIFGYSFLYENQDNLKAVKVAGVAPVADTIADGSYGISRPIFFYVKNAHRRAIPGLQDFLKEYVSAEAMGKNGYLIERGLVPLSDAKFKEVQAAVLGGTKMAAPK